MSAVPTPQHNSTRHPNTAMTTEAVAPTTHSSILTEHQDWHHLPMREITPYKVCVPDVCIEEPKLTFVVIICIMTYFLETLKSQNNLKEHGLASMFSASIFPVQEAQTGALKGDLRSLTYCPPTGSFFSLRVKSQISL